MAKVKVKAKAKAKKAVCAKCGVDERENTSFCYNCGSPLGKGGSIATAPAVELNGSDISVDANTQAALDDLAERFKIEEPLGEDKLAKAAAERRKARVRAHKPKEFIWEPVDDSSNRRTVLLAVLITAIAAGIVFLTIFY